MVGIEHNTELDSLGKGLIPEGFGKKNPHVDSLAVDRSKQAKTVVDDPNKVVTFGDGSRGTWKNNTNKADLKNFDTPNARERPKISAIKDLKGIRGYTTSGEDAMIEEPDRFLKYYNQELSKDEMSKITDFKSFVEATRKVFNRDNSLPSLWENVEGREKGLLEVFNTKQVQSWVTKNSQSFIIDYIMVKKNIERGRAEQVFSRLNSLQKARVIKRFKARGMPKINLVSKRTKTVQTGYITQTRGTTTYQRVKPVKWTNMQQKFITNNKDKGWKWAFEYYNRIFPDKRTVSSIQNKVYRMRKAGVKQ